MRIFYLRKDFTGRSEIDYLWSAYGARFSSESLAFDALINGLSTILIECDKYFSEKEKSLPKKIDYLGFEQQIKKAVSIADLNLILKTQMSEFAEEQILLNKSDASAFFLQGVEFEFSMVPAQWKILTQEVDETFNVNRSLNSIESTARCVDITVYYKKK